MTYFKLIILVAFLPFFGEAAKRIYYKTWFLDNYCGAELRLGIANLSQSLGAGTLAFRSYPQQPCSVNVTFALGSSRFAIYANIKAAYLRRGDSLIFFERRGTTARLIKRLRPASDGTIHGYTNPTSVDHFRTSFGQELTLCIQFLEGSVGMMPLQSPLTLDFNFIMETLGNTDLYTYCSALSGYIHQQLFCETGDRINCPAAYNYNVYGLNPAFAKDYDSVDKFGAIFGTNNPPDTANEEYIRPRWPNRNSSFARRRFTRKYEIDHGRPWVSIAPTTTASPVVVKTGPAYRKNQWEAYTINYWMFTSPVPSFRKEWESRTINYWMFTSPAPPIQRRSSSSGETAYEFLTFFFVLLISISRAICKKKNRQSVEAVVAVPDVETAATTHTIEVDVFRPCTPEVPPPLSSPISDDIGRAAAEDDLPPQYSQEFLDLPPSYSEVAQEDPMLSTGSGCSIPNRTIR